MVNHLPHDPVHAAAKGLMAWILQLKTESDLCISEILDAVEPPGGVADAATQTQASAGVDRIAERICDVMSAYDSLLESLGEDKYFAECIRQLNAE